MILILPELMENAVSLAVEIIYVLNALAIVIIAAVEEISQPISLTISLMTRLKILRLVESPWPPGSMFSLQI